MSELKKIAEVVRRYRRLGNKYHAIQTEFGLVCNELRNIAGKDRRVVVFDGDDTVLLTTDRFANFDVKQIRGELELHDSPMVQIVCCAAEKIDAIDRGCCPC